VEGGAEGGSVAESGNSGVPTVSCGPYHGEVVSHVRMSAGAMKRMGGDGRVTPVSKLVAMGWSKAPEQSAVPG
jgi:hypothetical protein